MKQKVKTLILWIIFFIISLYLAGSYATTHYGFDTDLFWHLKIGKDILTQKRIFLQNDYTWLSNTIWSQQEWLFDVLLYIVATFFGIAGFFIIHLIPQYLLMGINLSKQKYHFDLMFPIVCFLIYKFLPFNNLNRPAEFSSYLFLLIFFLYDKTYNWKPLLYFAVGVFIANFHCGAAVPLFVCIVLLFVLDIILNLMFFKINNKPMTISKKFFLQYLIGIVLFIFGLFINPYGWRQVKDMFCVINLDSTKYINEWQPLSSDNYFVWILILILAYSFGYALNKHKWNKTETLRILMLSAFFVLSLTCLKSFIIFFYIYIVYGYKYLDEMLYDFIQKINLKIIANKVHFSFPSYMPHKNGVYMLTFVCAAWFSLIVGVYNSASIPVMMARSNHYASEKTIDYLKNAQEESDDFRIFNGYVTGNILLYNDVKCFIDTRQFPYAKEFMWSKALDDYDDSIYMGKKYNMKVMDKFFNKYKFTYALSNKETDINWYLSQKKKDWHLVYSHNGEYVWQRLTDTTYD